MLVSFISISVLFPKLKRLVSSAKRRGSKLVAVFISFTKSVKRIGPRTDPCGTPFAISFDWDFIPLKTVYVTNTYVVSKLYQENVSIEEGREVLYYLLHKVLGK